MGSPPLKAFQLGEAERAALEALAARRRTAQGLALRARIVLAAPRRAARGWSARGSLSTPTRCANGATASPCTG